MYKYVIYLMRLLQWSWATGCWEMQGGLTREWSEWSAACACSLPRNLTGLSNSYKCWSQDLVTNCYVSVVFHPSHTTELPRCRKILFQAPIQENPLFPPPR